MAARDEIVRLLRRPPGRGGYPDASPVGLQVPGAAEVATVASRCIGVARAASSARRPQAPRCCFVHHGLFWDNEPRRHRGLARRRGCRRCFDADLSLVAYHLCLDAHPGVGNNAHPLRAARARAAWSRSPSTAAAPSDSSGSAVEPRADRSDELAAPGSRARSTPNRSSSPQGRSASERVAVVSGARRRRPDAAAEAGADAFVTGEAAEPAMYRAAEAGDSLRGRRPLRDGGIRGARAGRPGGPDGSASSTSSSTSRTRSPSGRAGAVDGVRASSLPYDHGYASGDGLSLDALRSTV